MDPSALRSPDQGEPILSDRGDAPNGDALNRDTLHRDRRRSVRQKLRTPVYVSFDSSGAGVAVDLSELLDLNEEGFAVQTSERLEVDRVVTLCLDLPETNSYIHGNGQVIWSDETGRSGIRFCALDAASRQVLRQWLFANLLVASHHVSRAEERAYEEEKRPAPVVVNKSEPEIRTQSHPVISLPEPGEALSIEFVRREICNLGDDIDMLFHLITERAHNLTGASGAALAFLTDHEMLCRARFGEPAPPLGSSVEIKRGLSGECVRSGLPVSCEDIANDARVDPEVGRALGIGSLIAVPLVSDFRVVGLLEVFSPHPRAFTKTHEAMLERLVELIPSAHHRTIDCEAVQLENPGEKDRAPVRAVPRLPVRETSLAEPALDPRAETSNPPPRLVYRALLGLVTVVVATVLGYVVGPIVGKHWLLSPQAAQRTSAEVVQAASAAAGQHPQPMPLAELRRLANQGDADAEWQMGIRCHADNPPDDAQALQWFERAADQGYVAAEATLGAYYWAGRGVPSDLSKAYMWSAIAFAGGDQNSKIRLEGLASQMTRAQISAARQQAELWIHQHNGAKP